MQSHAATVDAYLDALSPERRAFVEGVRDTIVANLPDGYEEGMQYGMIGYYVPLERYPHTYNGQPLGYVALASQKRYVSLYLTCVYLDPQAEADLRHGFAEAGNKLDMGRSCLRFRKPEDVPHEVIGRAVARDGVDAFIAKYEAARG